MEIGTTTIIFAKRKARQKRDEEKELLMRFNSLQERLRHNFDESIKAEMDRAKNKFANIIAVKTRGAIVRSRSRLYEFGEKNSKWFYNLEKRNHRKKTYYILEETKRYYSLVPKRNSRGRSKLLFTA